MRRSHGSAGDGVRAAIQPGRDDIDARREDVEDTAVVAEAGHVVVDVGSADGASGSLRGRGDVCGVLGFVAGCDGHEETRGDGAAGCRVDGGGVGTA